MAATKTISGARVVFFWNGDPVAYASGVDGGEEIMYEPVECLDDLAVKEYVPVGYRVNFSCRIFRTVAQGESSKNTPGSLKQIGLFPQFKKILLTEGVDAAIQDSITGKVIYLLEQAKSASYNFDIQARGLATQNMQFNAIRMLDESEIQGLVAQSPTVGI